MAEITRQRSGELMRAVFNILEKHPEGLLAREVIRQVEALVPPSEFELSEYEASPGSRRFDKIIRFQTICPVKAGWMTKDKGTWKVTPDGIAAALNFPDDADFTREGVRLYRIWRKGEPASEIEDGNGEIDIDPPYSSVTLEEAEETARQETRDHLAKMNPYEVQDLVAALLRAMGYHVSWIAPPGPDKGVDIVAFTDPLGASGPRIRVQVKRRADKIRVDEIRSFIAVISGSDVGIFISLGGFTPDSQSEARHQESRRISLIDVDGLIDLWIENYSRLPEHSRQLMPLKAIYYLAAT
jgi:restriction system protein